MSQDFTNFEKNITMSNKSFNKSAASVGNKAATPRSAAPKSVAPKGAMPSMKKGGMVKSKKGC